MANPCTVVVTLEPLPDCVDQVAGVVLRERDEIRSAAGCELYELYRAVDESVVLIERWSTREHWQAHFDEPAVARLKKDLTPLLAAPARRVEMYSGN
ncbi:MAG: antibiotic biosynthesis monooxygenase [Pontimonas sp.]